MALPAINIDTLEIAKELEGAGVPQQQAEAQTRIYVKIINMVIEERLPTKTDLKDTEQYLASRMDDNDLKLDKKIDEVDKRLSAKIDELDKRLSARIDELDKRLSAKIDELDKRLSARIDELDKRLSAKIDELDKRLSYQILELKHEMHDLYQKMLIRLGGLMISGVIVLAALIKL